MSSGAGWMPSEGCDLALPLPPAVIEARDPTPPLSLPAKPPALLQHLPLSISRLDVFTMRALHVDKDLLHARACITKYTPYNDSDIPTASEDVSASLCLGHLSPSSRCPCPLVNSVTYSVRKQTSQLAAAHSPPSITRSWPVKNRLASPEHINTTIFPSSAGCANRPKGVMSLHFCIQAGSQDVMSVETYPGERALTAMPY